MPTFLIRRMMIPGTQVEHMVEKQQNEMKTLAQERRRSSCHSCEAVHVQAVSGTIVRGSWYGMLCYSRVDSRMRLLSLFGGLGEVASGLVLLALSLFAGLWAI